MKATAKEINRMSSEAWKPFSQFMTTKAVPARTTLLREGQVSKCAYFIEEGCIRSWFNHDGKDITFQFFFEGEGVSSVESFRSGLPSLFSLETIEPCRVLMISKKDFQFAMDHSPAIKDEIEEHTFRRLIFYQQLFLSRIKNNPQQRYEELLRQRPEIFERIPQHFIASYLGITPVSLSRIRSRH